MYLTCSRACTRQTRVDTLMNVQFDFDSGRLRCDQCERPVDITWQTNLSDRYLIYERNEGHLVGTKTGGGDVKCVTRLIHVPDCVQTVNQNMVSL